MTSERLIYCSKEKMDLKEHWNNVYQTKGPLDVSWHQDRPSVSLGLIEEARIGKADGIIDVGGGASTLAECLLVAGYGNLAVLDLSVAALSHAQKRLGARSSEIMWIEGDVTEFVSPRHFGLWHDRAVFHFLTKAEDRHKYIENLSQAVGPYGHAIIATFASDGPAMCSGLNVMRYDAGTIAAELGPRWKMVQQIAETHQTPWAAEQKFNYFRFRKNLTRTDG